MFQSFAGDGRGLLIANGVIGRGMLKGVRQASSYSVGGVRGGLGVYSNRSHIWTPNAVAIRSKVTVDTSLKGSLYIR